MKICYCYEYYFYKYYLNFTISTLTRPTNKTTDKKRLNRNRYKR